MTYTPERLNALIAAIDAGDLGTVEEEFIPGALPDGVAGSVLLAAKACQRAREAAVDAIAAACEGKLPDAVYLADEAERHATVLCKRLNAAKDLLP